MPDPFDLPTPLICPDNLTAFVAFVAERSGYDLIPDELQAITLGVRSTDAEAERWYEYPMVGRVPVRLSLAVDPGSNVVWWRAECGPELRSAVDLAAGLMQEYLFVGGRYGQRTR